MRVDTGVREGDAVTPFYDPMIAKIIAWATGPRGGAGAAGARAGRDRRRRRRDQSAAFWRGSSRMPDFAAGAARYRVHRAPSRRCWCRGAAAGRGLAAAALRRLASRSRSGPRRRGDPIPGRRATAGGSTAAGVAARCSSATASEQCRVRHRAGADLAPRSATSRAFRRGERRPTASRLTARRCRGGKSVLRARRTLAVFVDGESWRLELVDPLAPPAGAERQAGRLTAPMPGQVIAAAGRRAGDTVARGAAADRLEAMKMEHTIAAPRDGVVEAVRYAAGRPGRGRAPS